MLRPIQLLLLILFLSCNSTQKTNYAIRDFRQQLQPVLVKMVNDGYVSYDDSVLSIATNTELSQLMQSEHPILRAMAFRAMLNRKSIDHFTVLMNHLSDTAGVLTDHGEFGMWWRTVSDDILLESVWNTQDAKNKTIEQVLTKHNYLKSAYLILSQIEPQEKYYPVIEDMATRPRRLTADGWELDFDQIEYALYGLARFKKPEDRHIIRKALRENVSELSHISFQLMKEFPDNEYSEIFHTYHRWYFYRFSGNRRDGFTGYSVGRSDPEDFINALVAQKTSWSAMLLDTMLSRIPAITCLPDKKGILDNVVMAIWENPDPVYASLRKKVKARAMEIKKSIISFEMDPAYIPGDTSSPEIRWEP